MKSTLFLISFITFLLVGCGNYNNVDKTPAIVGDIEDNAAWYDDMNLSILNTRIDIPVPNDFDCAPYYNTTLPPRPCTLEDVLNDTDANDDYEPELHVHYENDEYMREGVNADFIQKGKTTRHGAQKSFRVKLDTKTDLFKGERTMQLNKHPFDRSRMRNKLFFEIFQDIPNFPSLKTRFVDLKINGEEQGLYTHIEKCDKIYLKNHNFGEKTNLYKAQNFAFRVTPEMALDDKGNPVDPDAFDSVITIVNGKETPKLIKMLNEINAANSDEAFMKVFNHYFNRDNYITWMAVNIVTGNKDTISQNFFLLNPKYSDVFYFAPWDYDGAGRDTVKYAKWERGIGTWWGIGLHKKFLKIKQNRDDLDKMVYFLRNNYISDEIVHTKMDSFRPIVEPYILSSPDGDHLSYRYWIDDFTKLRDVRIAENVANYESEKGMPMPFWQLVDYDTVHQILHLQWDESVDLEGDAIAYTLKVASDANLTNLYVNETNITKEDPRITYESWGNFRYDANVTLPSGHYYMQVISYEINNPAHYQIAFDKEVEIDDVKYFGLLEFKVD